MTQHFAVIVDHRATRPCPDLREDVGLVHLALSRRIISLQCRLFSLPSRRSLLLLMTGGQFAIGRYAFLPGSVPGISMLHFQPMSRKQVSKVIGKALLLIFEIGRCTIVKCTSIFVGLFIRHCCAP
jgi:hypothetical protein